MKARLGGLVASALWLVASSSSATLTPSELVLVRQYTGGAQVANVPRVRALVARPDLTDAESAEAMASALAVPVTDARVAFLRELVFGAGSQASRNVLTRAVTRGLVARADAIFERSPNLDAPQSAEAAELLRIYGFLAGDLAGAGSAPFAGTSARPVHDASAGIDNATYEECAKALADHLKRHAAHLLPGAPLSTMAARVRAQAMLATFDMGGDSPTRAVDGSDRLGLDAVRRALLLDRGILLLDSGKSEPALAAAADLVRRLRPLAVDHVEAIYFGEEHPGLRSRGLVLAIAGAIDSTEATRAFPEDEVEPSPVHSPLADLAAKLSVEASKRTLASHGDLRVLALRDAPPGVSPEAAVGSMLGMMLVDAPRAAELAMVRFLAGKPESAALLADAVGVLAASAGPGGVQSLVVGKASPDGTSAPLPLSSVRLLPSGAASSFSLGTHWELTRGDTGIVTGVRRDGQPLAFGMLAAARVPVSGGQSWSGGGFALDALRGSPLVGVVPGPVHVRMVGQGDFDAARIAGSGPGASIDAGVRATGPFAVLLRARGGKADYGIGLRVVPGAPTRVAIVTVDDKLAEHTLAESTALPSVEHVHVDIRGDKIHVICTHQGRAPQTVSLEAPVPQQLTAGDVAFVVKKGVTLEIASPSVRRN